MATARQATRATRDRAVRPGRATAPVSLLVADAHWRQAAAPHLGTAIVELERAVAAMPASLERLLLNRALRTCALSFRECTRTPAQPVSSELPGRAVDQSSVRP